MDKQLIGIDLGGTTTKFAVVTTNGEVKEQWSIKTDVSEQGSKIVPNIIDSINDYLTSNNLEAADFLGIGMGSPGTVNREAGTVVGAYNLNWTEVQPIREQVESATGIDFYLDNDANVAALGEQWLGAGGGEPNVIFVTLGTGVGGGIIENGRLVHGAMDAAGEIGHITVDPLGFRYECTCGKISCLETVASATGIVRVTREKLAEDHVASQLDTIDQAELEAKDVFDAAKAGDEFALEVVDLITEYLALAVGNLACALNPSTIVIGGGVSQAGRIVTDHIEQSMQKYLFPTLRDKTAVRLAELGSSAGVIGASSLVLQEKELV